MKLLYIQPFARQVGTQIRQSKCRLLSCIVVCIRSDYLKCLIFNADNQMPTLHVSQCRHVGDDIILLMTTEVIFQVLALGFAALLAKNSFHSQPSSSFGYCLMRYCCNSCSVILCTFVNQFVSKLYFMPIKSLNGLIFALKVFLFSLRSRLYLQGIAFKGLK